MGRTVCVLFATLLIAPWPGSGKIMRNNALLSKMMSDYKDKTHQTIPGQDEQGKPAKVLSLMQNVLCRNFPSIPCKLITQDEKLRQLIQESIQEIKYKREEIASSTEPPQQPQPSGYEEESKYPMVNSEDLSNFLQVRNTGYFDEKDATPAKHGKHAKKVTAKKVWIKSPTKTHTHHEFDTQTVYGKKKIRKFYPHKVKYKDKHDKRHTKRTEYVVGQNNQPAPVTVPPQSQPQDIRELHSEPGYRADLGEAPVWRIDYTKHGEPRFNLMGPEEQVDTMKTGHNVIVDKNGMEGMPRKDVLHSDVYIKKNYAKKVEEFNSEGF